MAKKPVQKPPAITAAAVAEARQQAGYNAALEAEMAASPPKVLWTAEDVATLRRYYGKVSKRALMAALGRSGAAISGKADRMGLCVPHDGGKER